MAHNLFELSDNAAPVAVKAIDGPSSYCQLACQTLEITMRQVEKRKVLKPILVQCNVLFIQGDFFNWASPEFAKCWRVKKKASK